MLTIKNNTTDFAAQSSREWLYTNGIGGYASSSINGANTRRYHGLLVASFNPPTDRRVLVSKMDECIVFNRDCAFSLSSNRYPGAVHPNGYQYLKFFERKPFPRMKFESHGHHLLKTIWMVHGSNTTVVEYENTGETTFKLRLMPQFVYRDYHALFHERPDFDFWTEKHGHFYEMYAHYGASPLYFRFSKGEAQPFREWFRNVEYDRETERGLDNREDLFSVVQSDVVLAPGEKVFVVFSTDKIMMDADPEVLKINEINRMQQVTKISKNDTFLKDLLVAGEQFLVKRDSTKSYSLIAGYHWFTDWGRDTMIAMRGLTIATGQQAESKSIIETFLQYLDQGMLPNRFPDHQEEVEYNTIDATLWLFVVLYEYYQKFNDKTFIASVFDRLTAVLEWHIKGTRYQIHMTPEGFLSGGEGLAQLTWMDARVGDYVVTPRHGCPVEIQALWYNALRIHQYFAGTLKQPFEKYAAIADNLSENFKKYFIQPGGGLYDVIVPGLSVDGSIRPNQIYAVSLPFALLSREMEKAVVETVRRHLLTPYGLRTLSPEHPDFKPVYAGSPWDRDTAYHQGTVWPFLLGEYITACLKVNDWSEKSYQDAYDLLEPLKKHFYQEGCIFGISEIFDGKNPQTGKGTANQAWSVAAVLKILIELKQFQSRPKIKNKLPFMAVKSLIF